MQTTGRYVGEVVQLVLMVTRRSLPPLPSILAQDQRCPASNTEAPRRWSQAVLTSTTVLAAPAVAAAGPASAADAATALLRLLPYLTLTTSTTKTTTATTLTAAAAASLKKGVASLNQKPAKLLEAQASFSAWSLSASGSSSGSCGGQGLVEGCPWG